MSVCCWLGFVRCERACVFEVAQRARQCGGCTAKAARDRIVQSSHSAMFVSCFDTEHTQRTPNAPNMPNSSACALAARTITHTSAPPRRRAAVAPVLATVGVVSSPAGKAARPGPHLFVFCGVNFYFHFFGSRNTILTMMEGAGVVKPPIQDPK